jgi:hypothetical protein
VFSDERKGQWIAVIEMEREEILNAKDSLSTIWRENP